MLIYLQLLESEEDKANFEYLYKKYRGLMYHVAYEVLHNREDAEDAVQKAFLAIIKNFHKLHDVNSRETRSYCVLCSKSKAIDIIREKQHREVLDLNEEEYGYEMPFPDDTLSSAIKALSPNLSVVILLHYDNGFDMKEIAKSLNITEAAAKKRLTRAKEELRKMLEEEGIQY